MSGLFISRRDEMEFDEVGIVDAVVSMDGISGFRENVDSYSRWEADFEYEQDSVEIYLDSNLRCVVISDESHAGIEFAWRLRKAISEPLRIFDESYSFDIPLDNFQSIADLEAAMDRAAEEDS